MFTKKTNCSARFIDDTEILNPINSHIPGIYE